MALLDVDVIVGFTDAAERTSEITYRLKAQYDTAAPASMGTVMTAVQSLETELNVLTMSAVEYLKVQVIEPGAGVANVAANNQVRAFCRTDSAVAHRKGYFEVPAWDDVVFDQDSNNLLSAAFITAAGLVAALLKDPVNGEDIAVEFAQSRTSKSRAKHIT